MAIKLIKLCHLKKNHHNTGSSQCPLLGTHYTIEHQKFVKITKRERDKQYFWQFTLKFGAIILQNQIFFDT